MFGKSVDWTLDTLSLFVDCLLHFSMAGKEWDVVGRFSCVVCNAEILLSCSMFSIFLSFSRSFTTIISLRILFLLASAILIRFTRRNNAAIQIKPSIFPLKMKMKIIINKCDSTVRFITFFFLGFRIIIIIMFYVCSDRWMVNAVQILAGKLGWVYWGRGLNIQMINFDLHGSALKANGFSMIIGNKNLTEFIRECWTWTIQIVDFHFRSLWCWGTSIIGIGNNVKTGKRWINKLK